MKKQIFPKIETREALSKLPENDQAAASPSRPVGFTYMPSSHARALDPESILVEGIRGAGKSFWFAALNSQAHRQYVTAVFPEARLGDSAEIVQGFGQTLSSTAPSKDSLAKLVKKFHAGSRAVWRAVVGTCLDFRDPFPTSTWDDKVDWTINQPEAYDNLLIKKDKELAESGKIKVILFDALDGLADDWPEIRPLARALFQVALELRASRAIRAKLFVRPDMVEDREILAFPDSSKLLARKVPLTWKKIDLYALLFQCLGNAANGAGRVFREHCHVFRLEWSQDTTSAAWKLPNPLRNDESVQRDVFHAIAGPAMASGPSGYKRGFPYTWLANHLMDGRDQVSPRSFLAALWHAVSQNIPDDWPYPLHYTSIQAGVQEASRIRVNEVREDYQWVHDVMEPLASQIIVPCAPKDIIQVWKKGKTLQHLRTRVGTGEVVKLPPQHIDKGEEGILQDLQELGLIQRLRDGRVQMPDVYRIAFKLGRKGGVKPLK